MQTTTVPIAIQNVDETFRFWIDLLAEANILANASYSDNKQLLTFEYDNVNFDEESIKAMIYFRHTDLDGLVDLTVPEAVAKFIESIGLSKSYETNDKFETFINIYKIYCEHKGVDNGSDEF